MVLLYSMQRDFKYPRNLWNNRKYRSIFPKIKVSQFTIETRRFETFVAVWRRLWVSWVSMKMPWRNSWRWVRGRGSWTGKLNHLPWTKWTPFRRRHFQMHFFNGNVWISHNISLNFIPKVRINNIMNIPALVQVMLGADQVRSHCLNQWWLDYWRIYASFGLNELRPGMGVQIWKKLIMEADFWYFTWWKASRK